MFLTWDRSLVVGLIMGTRMWYEMWDAEQDDDAAFEQRLDAVVREIGDRGKLLAPEAVTPVRELTPAQAQAQAQALALAPAPAPAPVPTAAAAPSPPRTSAFAPVASELTSSTAASVPTSTEATTSPATCNPGPVTTPQAVASSTSLTNTPSVQESSRTLGHEVGQASVPSSRLAVGVGTSFVEFVSFMKEERESMMSAIEKQRQETEAQRRESDAKIERLRGESDATIERLRAEAVESKLEAQRRELEAQRRELEAQRRASDEGKVAALQVRLEALYDAKLLNDDELSAIEDKVADALGAADVGDGGDDSAWECTRQMLKLSDGIASEKMFARQLRRKFV